MLRHRIPTRSSCFARGLTEAGAFDALFADFASHLKESDYLVMGDQIVDTTTATEPNQRNTKAEKDADKEGNSADDLARPNPPGQRRRALTLFGH